MEEPNCIYCKYRSNCEFAVARIADNQNTDPCEDFCDHYHAVVKIDQDPTTGEYIAVVDGVENENAYRQNTPEEMVDVIYHLWGRFWELEEYGNYYSIRISDERNGYIRVNGIPYVWGDSCIPWKSENGEISLPRWMGIDIDPIAWGADDRGVFVPIYPLVYDAGEYYPHVAAEECGYLLFAASEGGMIADQPDYDRPSKIIFGDSVSEIDSFANGWEIP